MNNEKRSRRAFKLERAQSGHWMRMSRLLVCTHVGLLCVCKERTNALFLVQFCLFAEYVTVFVYTLMESSRF